MCPVTIINKTYGYLDKHKNKYNFISIKNYFFPSYNYVHNIGELCPILLL